MSLALRPTVDDALAQRLPLPLAQLYRRAHNAKTPLERHHAGFYLWEATLKLLGSVAVVSFADLHIHDEALTTRLHNLARPSLGHWWEFVRLLLPVLAGAGDPHFSAAHDLILGRTRNDLPRAAGLDAVLLDTLEGKMGSKSTVDLAKLFDRLVQYRNEVFGHGAAGQHPVAFYARNGNALLAGMGELLGKLDVLAGRRLLYVAEVRQRGDGSWLIERGDLSSEMYTRLESDVRQDDATDRPWPERLYLHRPGTPHVPTPVHPLLYYDPDSNEMLFLNARRGKKRIEYLSYTTGRVAERDGLAGEQRELLRRVLDMNPSPAQVDAWSEQSCAEDKVGGGFPDESDESRPVGEFVRLSKLGEGGMGEVFRAWQPSLDRHVALKCLFRTGDPKAEVRFRREIQALGRVEHPHLVKIFTSGSDGDRWHYAMELIDGTTLASVCDRLQSRGSSVRDLDLSTWCETVNTTCAEARRAETPIKPSPGAGARPAAAAAAVAAPPPQPAPAPQTSRGYVRHVVKLMQQVAEAVHALHEKGIIHRDVKPGNIMVSADGAAAYLLDLGLAQIADEVEGKLTKTRQFVGTLRYASPEQVLAAGRLEPASDVYSLGATLWELLTLQPLYGAKEGTHDVELMRRIQFEEAGRLRKHHPGIPRDLEAIVEKSLQKDPRRRYASARALATELNDFLQGNPVQARPVGSLERGVKWVRRRPGVSALLGSLAAVILIAFGTVTWQLRATQEALKREEDARHAREEAEKGRALARVNALCEAAPGAVPGILADLELARPDVLPRLHEVWREGANGDPASRMRVGLALLPVEPDVVRDELANWLLRIDDPVEVVIVRDALLPHKAVLREQFWRTAGDGKTGPAERLRALAALAAFDPGGERWTQQASVAAEQILAANPLHVGTWVKAFQPVRGSLLKPLGEVFHTARSAERREIAATVLADYARDRPAELADLVLDADARQFAVLYPILRKFENAETLLRKELDRAAPGDAPEAAREALAQRQATAAVALMRLGRAEYVWPLFRHAPDPTLRSELLARVAPLGVEARQLAERLVKEEEPDISARRALLVALGEYTGEQLPPDVRAPLTAQLLRWYRSDPDPGLHGAIDWLLRHGKEGPEPRPLDWGQAEKLQAIDAELQGQEPDGKRRWYVNGEGQTMVVVPGPVEFRMGSPLSEPDRRENESPHRRRIGRSYALASKPVTTVEYQRFCKDRGVKDYSIKKFRAERINPMTSVTWYEAAQYCNWLSEKEGIPEDEWCYPRHEDIKEGMKLFPDYLRRKGYRLPTEAEWEFAARANATSSRYYGSSLDLLPRYAWYAHNATDRTWPVGQKRPNDFGFFDMHGNAWNWIQESVWNYETTTTDRPVEDVEDTRELNDKNLRGLRGGSFFFHPTYVRSAYRLDIRPSYRFFSVGFRVARTLP